MNKDLRSLVLMCAALPGAALCQTAKLSFDLADVRVSPRSAWVNTAGNRMMGGFLRGERYELKHATMAELIQTAFGVDADKVFGGPSWLEYDKFDVSAKTKPGTRPEAVRLMLQSLLEDRFKLVVKQETMPVPADALVVAKDKPKLKDAAGAGGGCTSNLRLGGDTPMGTIQCRNVTMEAFAGGLRRLSAATFGNLPVVDKTGIKGAYDIDLEYPLIPANRQQGNGEGLLAAIEKLGFKLQKGTAPQPVLNVESVNETPTPNGAAVEAGLPPLPAAQFEVASIRPCDGIGGNMTPRFETGGRVTMHCMYMSNLINQMFGLHPFEKPVGPKWLDDNSQPAYSLEAKAPPDAIPAGVGNAQQQEVLGEMMLGLFKERWGLKTHWEQRPTDALTLTAAKPKLTKADPAGRTGCKRDAASPQALKIKCTNMTMSQFAEQLSGLNPQIFYPVEDATNLEGAWDFSFTYNLMATLPPFPLAGRGGAAPTEASEPPAGLPFNEALDKQLGLKLETRKRPEPVLVIDQINEKPTDN